MGTLRLRSVVGHTMPVPHRATEPSAIAESDLDEDGIVEQSLHDPRAFAPLYARYAAPIYGYCANRLGSRQAAEDATSVIFAKALTSLPGYAAHRFGRGSLALPTMRLLMPNVPAGQRHRSTSPLPGSMPRHLQKTWPWSVRTGATCTRS